MLLIKKALVCFSIGLCLFNQAVLSNANADNTLGARIQYQKNRYIIGPNDVLSLRVLNEPQYDQPEILVRPDGFASFMGVGELKSGDKSIEELTHDIEDELKHTLLNPKVMLTVKSTRPGTVYLSGAVMHAGMFQFATRPDGNSYPTSDRTERSDMRLTNILANAGGVKMQADLTNIIITRAGNCNESECDKVHVNLWNLLKNGQLDEDVWVNNGDHIYIPENPVPVTNEADYEMLLRSSIGPKNFPVRVIGEVQKPGVYYLEGTSPLLNSAVAQAGGFAPQAHKNQVVVRRFTSDNHFSTFYLNLNKGDICLWPNDVVYVPENKIYKSGRFAEQVAHILSPFTSTAWSASNAATIFRWGAWSKD